MVLQARQYEGNQQSATRIIHEHKADILALSSRPIVHEQLFQPRRYHGAKGKNLNSRYTTTTMAAFVQAQLRLYSNQANVTRVNASLADRLAFYNASKTEFSTCETKTNKSYHRFKDVYHTFEIKFDQKITKGHYIRCYFDDRYISDTGRRYIRTTASFEGPEVFTHDPEKLKAFERWKQQLYYDITFFAYLWYKGFDEAITSKCFVSASGALVRNLNNRFYHQKVISCPIPEIHILPTKISLSTMQCGQIENQGFIHYPQGPEKNNEGAVGLCMSSMYGTLDDTFTPHFVNWMELLQLLGVYHVTTNNASLHLAGVNIQKAFAYYQEMGYLEINQYPVIEDNYPPGQSMEASNSISKMTTSDCYMRYMHRNWYTLIHDMDEIVIPVKFKTIAEFLREHLMKNLTLVDATCLHIRSAYHFPYLTESAKINAQYPNYLPLMQQTERWQVEEIGVKDKVGMSKSINNNRKLTAAGNHFCWSVLDPNYQNPSDFFSAYLPSDEILIHHFRRFCNLGARCNETTETVHDPVIADNWGPELAPRVKRVLEIIDWPEM